MVKKIFTRIWRTVIIIFNTFVNLMAMVIAVVAIFDRYAAEAAVQDISTAIGLLLIINLVDYITRKHIMNY